MPRFITVVPAVLSVLAVYACQQAPPCEQQTRELRAWMGSLAAEGDHLVPLRFTDPLPESTSGTREVRARLVVLVKPDGAALINLRKAGLTRLPPPGDPTLHEALAKEIRGCREVGKYNPLTDCDEIGLAATANVPASQVGFVLGALRVAGAPRVMLLHFHPTTLTAPAVTEEDRLAAAGLLFNGLGSYNKEMVGDCKPMVNTLRRLKPDWDWRRRDVEASAIPAALDRCGCRVTAEQVRRWSWVRSLRIMGPPIWGAPACVAGPCSRVVEELTPDQRKARAKAAIMARAKASGLLSLGQPSASPAPPLATLALPAGATWGTVYEQVVAHAAAHPGESLSLTTR